MELSLGVLLGLGTFFLWGVGDFYAAALCRTHGIQRTLMWTQILALGLAAAYPLYQFYLNPDFCYEIPLRAIWFLGILGAIQAVSYVVFYKGLGEGVVSVVSPISASWSLIAVLWGWFVWGEVLEPFGYGGVFLILSGIFLTAVQPAKVRELTGKQMAKGTLEGFIAMILWGISLTMLIPVTREYGWFLPVMVMRLWAFLFLVAFFFVFPRVLKTPRIVSPPLFAYAAVAACDIGGLFLFGEGVRHSLASIVAPVAASFPLITILLAAVSFREKLSWSQIVGIVFVLGGLILLSLC